MTDTVLLINHYAGSPHHGMEFRPYYLARHWNRMGYRTIVVAASHSHVRGTNPRVDRSDRHEVIDGVEYFWLRTPPYAGNGLGRLANMLVFVARLLFRRARLTRMGRVRAVVASSTYPLDIFPAWLIARRARARLIFEVHDLWPLSPVELGGYSRYHPFILVMQAAENFAYRHAHRVVSILPATLPHMVRHGLAAEKFVHVPNGIENDGPHPAEPLGAAVASMIPAGEFVVGYAGAVGIANALVCLVQAANLLRAQAGIRIVIAGDGPELPNLQRTARALGLSNVTFTGRIPKRQVPGLLERFDVCYIGLKNEPLFRFGVSPNKLFDYMYAGRPVLQAIAAGNDLVRDAGCGMTVAPDQPGEVAAAIRAFAAMPPAQRRRLGENGRRYVLANHTYARLADRFVKLFEER